MPGKLIVGVVGELRREDEGEYVCSRCTVFGLDCDEVQVLVRSGLKMTDCNKDEEGVEVRSSVFKVTKLPSARTDLYLKVLRSLGKELGYEIQGNPVSTDAPGGRTTMIYTLSKDL